MSSSAPGVPQRTSGPAIITGLRRRLQPHYESIALKPTAFTFSNALTNSGVPCNSFQNAFDRNANQNIFHQSRASTSENFIRLQKSLRADTLQKVQHSIHTYIIGHYNPSLRIICVLILYISGGTYSLKSSKNDKFFE